MGGGLAGDRPMIRDVVCTHGLWGHGIGMYFVKRRLERDNGLRAMLFSYRSVHGTLDENAAALYHFIRDKGLAATHLMGHSLGGVVVLRMLANYPDAVPGRVVCTGSPLTGSRTVEFLHEQDWAENIIGHSARAGVVHETANEWASHVCEQREVGIIAGTVSIGAGRLLTEFGEDNDGVIAVSETRLEGAKDHICLPVSHKGMLVSRDVADQAAAFLKRGEFLREM